MMSLLFLFAFVFGAIIGSFLNVVSLRWNTGMGVNGRSKCFSCGKGLVWHELIPIFSFAAQKGRCKKCKSKISWQYPIVEFLSGAVFALIFITFPPVDLASAITTILYLFITAILMVITIYDIKHKIIPDSLSYTFAVLAFISLFVGSGGVTAVTMNTSPYFHIPLLINLLAGPLCALPFAFLWLVSRGTWMGLGDAKLMLGIGWTLGFVAAVSSMVLAFWIGAVISVAWMLITFKKVKGHYEIPFAPYLILGMYIVLLFGINVIDLRPILAIMNIQS
jgi:prepilin signal peptidase PulO-like enzyme (type II secretory pathway)